ncbi:MAG TPA: DUF4382 domain-containing protein [Burkholderiales bacterium]|nr:DUF4382 domain-containing protein [Burkholderiales bacterium]
MNPQTGFAAPGFLRILKAFFFAGLLGLGLVSCGKNTNGETGTVSIGLTDAAGDFLSYAVDVTSLTLAKADGTVVQTLPQRTRIDFAQLVDLTEFVTGATIPAGNYVSATLQLDYTNADIEVDDGSGNPLKVAAGNIKDAQGNQVRTLSMTVQLDNAKPLPIAPGIPALFDLDFNLAASNQVDMTNPLAPVVTVSPLLVGDVNPVAPKPHRIRGPLDSVDTQAGTFTLVLRPFNLIQGDHGRLTFFTDSNTTFEIDQASYVGNAGLVKLSTETRFTATVAVGTFDLPNRRFVATEVLAGSSVAFGTDDALTGNVTSRTGNTFVVKGAELVRSSGTLSFGSTVTVTVGSGTKVLKEGVGLAAIGDISVGQRVTVLGTLDAPGTSLDATGGLVRLLVTQMNGVATSTSTGLVVMNLAKIDGRPVGLFNFAGTGTPDASPTSYEVATGTLPLTGISNGTPLKVRGFVQPFGAATATDDFNAITLINTTNAPATLVVGWPLLQATPFNSYAANGMAVNLTNSTLHDVFRGGVDTALQTTDTPAVQAPDPAHGLFVIGVNGMVQVYTQMSSYQAALQSNLATHQAKGFVAFGGTYTDATKTLSAGVMATALQ